MAERTPRMSKVTQYPQPHALQGGFSFECDDVLLDSTIVPIAFYDEGLGAPNVRETNPENAAFAVVSQEVNCFPNSRINRIFAQFRFSINSNFIDDNLTHIRFATMPIHMAFINDYTAIDELSTLEVQDLLEMQTESTDRQGGPLYVATTDLPEKAAGLANQGANLPFLDTDAGLEAVAFQRAPYYDSLQFLTIKEKMRKVSSGLQWHTLTRNRPIITYTIKIKPNIKRMNPFTYFGLLIDCPSGNPAISEQPHAITRDFVAATQYVDVDYNIRFNEWNEFFDSKLIS